MDTNEHEFIERPSIRVNSWLIIRGLEKSGIEDGPKMDDPSQQYKPKDRRQTKLDNCHQQAALKQLPQAGNKKTAESSQNITSRTLARHVFNLMSACAIDKSISRQIGSA